MLMLILMASVSFGTHSHANKAEKRQTYGNPEVLSLLPNIAEPTVVPSNTVEYLPTNGVIQQYPFPPQKLEYVQEIQHMFPDRPLPTTFSGGQFLGQLGQHIQQGLINHYTGNFPVGEYGPQILNHFAGVLGQNPGSQYPGGQFYTPEQYPNLPPSESVAGALASIAKYDDLKCVPRLLCEVAAGGRPGYLGNKQQDSSVPFVNRDTLLSLLTVLNFEDSSPLMVFGRAILLGITAKGDPNTCFSAYHACPRDHDRLVDYLNNHNGGFFRFFGTQRPYNPSYYQGRIQTGLSHLTTTGRPQDNRVIRGNKGQAQLQFSNSNRISTSLKPPLPPHVYRDPDYFRYETPTTRFSLVFPGNNRYSKASKLFGSKDTENSAVNTISFPHVIDSNNEFRIERPPSDQEKPSVPMTFPDKTGTGDLRLDVADINGPVISVSSPQNFLNPDGFIFDQQELFKYPQLTQNSNTNSNRETSGTMKFPTSFQENILNDSDSNKIITLKFPATGIQ